MLETDTRSLEDILKEFEAHREELLEKLDSVKTELEVVNRVLKLASDETNRTERVLAMWQMYEAGCTLQEVGLEFGVSRQYVEQLFKAAGYETRSREEVQELKKQTYNEHMNQMQEKYGEEIYELYDKQALPQQTVADRIGLSHSKVQELIQRMFTEEQRTEIKRRMFGSWIEKDISDEDLLEQLRQCAKDLGRTPGGKTFDKWAGTGRSQLVIIRYGTWSAACEAAGLKPNPRMKADGWGTKQFSDEDCKRAYNRIRDKLGRGLSCKEYLAHREDGEPSLSTLRRRNHNSWKEARAKYEE